MVHAFGLWRFKLAERFGRCRAAGGIRAGIAAGALLVDAKNHTAATFYRYHGFLPLPDTQLTLFLPLATVQASRRRSLDGGSKPGRLVNDR